ncbi:DUF1611 domain-containing protein [Sphingomonas sp. GCM10030256]|uniref:DUF1611 domain-containing protein n=1 Tax=Sphingomonas sp. GCM10030256 TaxID=3273427 RepID=UPI003618C245
MFHEERSVETESESVASERRMVLSQERLTRAKTAFTTRNVKLQGRLQLCTFSKPEPGDLVLARVEKLGQHQKLESPHGRRAEMYEGDEILVAFGQRYAPDQFESIVPSDLGACELVAAGGLASKVISKHSRMRRATRIQPVGLVADPSGRVFNLRHFALRSRVCPASRPRVVAVAGTSMNAGKTTTAAGIIHGLARAGLKVAAAKVTGTGSGNDLWSMLDAGASRVLDFTDMGFPSTAGMALGKTESIAASLVAHLADNRPDVIVLEIADGLFQRETAALLTSPLLRSLVDGVIFASADAMGALAGREWLLRRGHHVLAISGLFTASPLARLEAEEAMGQKVCTLEQLRDPLHAPTIVFCSTKSDGILRAAE